MNEAQISVNIKENQMYMSCKVQISINIKETEMFDHNKENHDICLFKPRYLSI